MLCIVLFGFRVILCELVLLCFNAFHLICEKVLWNIVEKYD